jgi:putative ABC transport system permease protein
MGPAQTSWRVVGVAREPFFPPIAYIPKAFFEQSFLHPGMANRISLAVAKDAKDKDKSGSASISAVKASLDRNLEQEGVRALSSTSLADSRFGFDQHMVMIYVFLIVVSCIIGGVGGLGLMTTMSLNVLERRREMGVLRAIGASSGMVWLMIVTEGSLIGLMSWALAALAAWPVSKGLGDLMVMLILKSGLDFYFAPLGLLIWFAVSISLGAVSSFLPAWRASQRPVREAIGYE